MHNIVKNILLTELSDDSYEFGFAELANLLDSDYKDFQYGIAIVKKLDDEIIKRIEEGPTLEYYNHYCNINRELNDKVNIISNKLQSKGIKSLGIKSTYEDNELDDKYFKTLRLNFSHKMVATRAGLGWIGKTDLFISKKFGPRVRLASVLINKRVKSRFKSINHSFCGSCSVCVDTCPAKAANGRLWSINIDRDEFFDPFKCRENCIRLSKERIGKNISLCGICVSVCPRGKLS
jgi:epoxyqueuosine reductase QueG